ncbi:hypothetical protein MRB53_032279 [Persea americana]|uniref:Uncharacterized protein n=1 Tax=Persea americana TaxID=3435 RepID=A0ACC2KRE1_PERAE|nr:hypothetical protein MRB53_032279 [Persea americana]
MTGNHWDHDTQRRESWGLGRNAVSRLRSPDQKLGSCSKLVITSNMQFVAVGVTLKFLESLKQRRLILRNSWLDACMKLAAGGYS